MRIKNNKLVCIILIALGFVLLILFSSFNKNIFEKQEFNTSGFIRGYIEPITEDDEMQVYVVLSDRVYATELAVYAIPKTVYQEFSSEFKSIIDNRKIGCLVSFSAIYIESDFSRTGYSYFSELKHFRTDLPMGEKLQHRDLEW